MSVNTRLDVIPILLANSATIIAKRFDLNTNEMSEKLEEYMQTRSEAPCTYVIHGKIYVVRHDGAYKRAMLKFTSPTGERNMTLLDEKSSLVQTRRCDFYLLRGPLLNEEFGILKIKIQNLKIVDAAAAANIFDIYARDTRCQANVRLEKLSADTSPVNNLYIGDVSVPSANSGQHRSLREILIEKGAGINSNADLVSPRVSQSHNQINLLA